MCAVLFWLYTSLKCIHCVVARIVENLDKKNFLVHKQHKIKHHSKAHYLYWNIDLFSIPVRDLLDGAAFFFLLPVSSRAAATSKSVQVSD